MNAQQLRCRIEALEATVSQETKDVIEERQHFPLTPSSQSSNQAAHAESQATKANQNGAPGVAINDVLGIRLGEEDNNTTQKISILTRPLKSLRYAKFIIPSHFYPSFSVKYGITHWAVEVGGRVFEVRTEGWKGKGGKMTIREESSQRPEYSAENVDRYAIGVGPDTTVASFREMRTQLQMPGFRKYHFYKNNCQLIAAAMAVAGCQQPAAGFKTLVFRDDLQFFNRNNPGDLLKVLDELLPEQKYYGILTEVESDYNQMRKRRRRSSMNSSMQTKVALARDALSDTAEYALYGLMYPFAILLLTIEQALEALEAYDRFSQLSRPPWPDNLFGLPVKNPRSVASYQEQPRYDSFSPPRSYARAPPAYTASKGLPRYTVLDRHEADLEDANELWICAMYGWTRVSSGEY